MSNGGMIHVRLSLPNATSGVGFLENGILFFRQELIFFSKMLIKYFKGLCVVEIFFFLLSNNAFINQKWKKTFKLF